MAYLGWILSAILGGVLLTGLLLLRKREASCRQRFSRVDSFADKTYAQVYALGRSSPQETRVTQSGQVLRTWRDRGYSITLLFDQNDICLGVEDERQEKE